MPLAHCEIETPGQARRHTRRPARRRPPRRPARRKSIALVQAPILRLLGSENRRAAPGAILDANLLLQHGYEVTLIHADASDQPGKWLSWRELFASSAENLHEEGLLDRLRALWPEVRRRIAQVEPDEVVVLAGDWVEPAKDIADTLCSVELGRLITEFGVRCVAVGGLPSRFPERFAETYSAAIDGAPGRTLIEAIERPGSAPGRLLTGGGPRAYLNIPARPCRADASLDYSQVVTEFGCHYGRCGQFCPIARLYGPGCTVRSDDLVEQDIQSRSEQVINNVDTSFGWDPERWRRLASRLAPLHKEYVVSTRIEYAVEPAVQDVLKWIGCRMVKLGVESLSDRMLARMGKGQTASEVMAGLQLLHEEGIDLFGYLLLGPPGESAETLRETLARARELDFVHWLPNVYCPIDDPSPEAHHFSRPQAAKLGLPLDIVEEFFELSARHERPGVPQPVPFKPVTV